MVMQKISDFIVKYKQIILLVFIVILAISIVGTVFLVTDDDKINSDMMSYLSDDFDTTSGLTFLKANFNIRGDATIVVRGSADDAELRSSVEKIKKMDGISQLIWVEDAQKMAEFQTQLEGFDIDLGNLDTAKIEESLQSNAVFKSYSEYLNLLGIKDMTINTVELQKYLKREISGSNDFDYVLLIMMNYAPSTSQAYTLLDNIKAEFSGRSYASSGMTETAQTVMDDTLSDLPNFLVYAVIAVIVILLLTTSSFIEPLILLFTLGASIVISMGVNYLYPSISIISFATSAVLQLAITLDYAIFFMHTYKRKRLSMEAVDATRSAIPEAANSIFASGLTTIGGFAALYFMRFGVGADISNVLIKGIVLSILSVLILQPILTLLMDKLIISTTHNFTEKINAKIKEKKPNSKGISQESIIRPVAKFSVWQRIVLTVVAVALLVPCYIGQSKLSYSYFEMYEAVYDTPEKQAAYELGNQMIMAVPLNTKTGTHNDFIKEVLADPTGKVGGVMSAFSSVNVDVKTLTAMLNILVDGYDEEKGKNTKIESFQKLINNLPENIEKSPSLYEPIFEEMGIDIYALMEEYDFAGLDIMSELDGIDLSVLSSYFAKVDDVWYTMYTINIKGSAEDDTAAECYEYLNTVRLKYFGKESYSIGMLTGSYDMRKVTPIDFMRVTVASVLIIFVIVAFLLRNPLKSLIMVLIIELGIWINLSVTMLLGENLNFMIYIIISSVQLGCTVDYAILFANTYEMNRAKYSSGKECAIKTAIDALPAIYTSALLIISVCLSVYFVSDNLIITQLTGMLARGAAISAILVTLVQTAVWSLFKTERRKIDFNKKIEELDKQIQK